jgi:hypothetical protein
MRGEQAPGELDVLAGVGRLRLYQNRLIGDSESNGVLAVVNGLTTGKPFFRRGGVRAGEDDARNKTLVVQLGRKGRDPKVMASETNTDVTWPDRVMHVVVVPQRLNIRPELTRNGYVNRHA